ncbi:hypothetical protein QQX98_002705, partial [Neonectria punicea]
METPTVASPLPAIALVGPIPSSLNSVLKDLATRFEILHYKPASTEWFLSDIQSSLSPIHAVSAILRLGSFKSTNLQHDWAHSLSTVPSLPRNLKLLINNAHGLDSQPVEALSARGITILGSGGGTNTTATAALYLTIGAYRNFSNAEISARAQNKSKFFEAMGKAWESRDPAGKSVGIVGYGRIGKRVGELLSALGMEVHCLNRSHGPGSSLNGDGVFVHGDLDEMVSGMDCVVLCCPYTPETHHILDWKRIQSLKRGVRIINVARGKCIDEEALVKGLEEEIVGGAGLDVYEN